MLTMTINRLTYSRYNVYMVQLKAGGGLTAGVLATDLWLKHKYQYCNTEILFFFFFYKQESCLQNFTWAKVQNISIKMYLKYLN